MAVLGSMFVYIVLLCLDVQTPCCYHILLHLVFHLARLSCRSLSRKLVDTSPGVEELGDDSFAQNIMNLMAYFQDRLHIAAEECELLLAICITASLNTSIELCVKGQAKVIKGWSSLRRVLKKYVFTKAPRCTCL